MPEREQHQASLAEVLDRLLELGANDNAASFRKLAEAAQLDPSRDFIGASLRNIDMRDEDLRGFDFSNADLAGSDFRRANVQGVRFQNANLEDVIGLRDAALSAPWTTSRNAFTLGRELEQYRVFIGSPAGLWEEREAFHRVLTAFNEHHGELNGIVFEPFRLGILGWRRRPAAGIDQRWPAPVPTSRCLSSMSAWEFRPETAAW